MHNRWLLCLILFPLLSNAQANKLPKTKHSFIVVAHRGDHTEAPENTLLAYKNAIKVGADYVEIDLRTTKDSQLVIMHDASLLRMVGLNKKVQECIFDSIKNLSVRDVNHPEWGSHKIPGFEEVLKLCRGKINIYLDFKDASVTQTYKAIVAHKMEKHVVVYINAPQQFIDWRRIAPSMPLMISLPKKIATKSMMDSILTKYPTDILDGNYNDYTIATVQASQARGIPIWADIQGKDEDQYWLIALALGVNGLQTDHPKALIDFLKYQKKR